MRNDTKDELNESKWCMKYFLLMEVMLHCKGWK